MYVHDVYRSIRDLRDRVNVNFQFPDREFAKETAEINLKINFVRSKFNRTAGRKKCDMGNDIESISRLV